MMNEEFQQKNGKKAVIVAIAANIFLTILNVTVGIISGSAALVSEGAHTFSDIITTVIAYIGFRYSQKPADFEHPIGYGRAQAISGLVIVLFLFVVAWEIIEKALKYVLFNEVSVPDVNVAIMAFVGIIVNMVVSTYIISIGKQIKSPAIIADGKHQRADIFTSIAILVGVVVSNMGYPFIDPIIAIVIGILIVKIAIEIFIANVNHILGKIPSEEFVQRIYEVADSVPQAHNPHEIMVDCNGSYAFVSLHVELDENLILRDSHKIAHEVQDKILDEIPEVKYVIVHTCPLGDRYSHKQEI